MNNVASFIYLLRFRQHVTLLTHLHVMFVQHRWSERLATSRLSTLSVGDSSANQAICSFYWALLILLLPSDHRVTVSSTLALICTWVLHLKHPRSFIRIFSFYFTQTKRKEIFRLKYYIMFCKLDSNIV